MGGVPCKLNFESVVIHMTKISNENIRDFRLSTGLSQRKFAEYFGLPIRTLQEWEQGRRKSPSYLLELLKRIWKLESH